MGLLLWWAPFKAADVATLMELHAAGVLQPSIDRRYPFAELVEALRYVQDGLSRGKVVITF
jgi:NADPH:quinone reductase-like Zn-dependent oxidoreductase